MEHVLPIITDPYYCNSSWFKAMHQSIVRTALAQKCDVKVFAYGLPADEIRQLPETVVLASGVLSYTKETVSVLESYGKKVILAGLLDAGIGTEISSVSSTVQYEVKMVIDYLCHCDRRKIALVGFREKGMNDAVRYREIKEYCKGINDKLTEPDVYFRGNSIEKCVRTFFNEIYRYDAAVCPNGAAAIYLINYCKQNQVEIPEDLFVISFSDMNVASYSSPSLTCVDSDFQMIGKKVVTLWNYLSEHHEEEIVANLKVRSRLYVRESTANIPFVQEKSASVPDNVQAYFDKYYENRVTNTLFSLESEMQGCDSVDYCIIRMIIRGLSYEQMTDEIFMSVSGIRYRVKRLFDKLHVNSKNELIKKVLPLIGEDLYYEN